jgi:hypothetical protein
MLPADRYLVLDSQGTVEKPDLPSTIAEFLLRCLLGARAEAELPTGDEDFAEEVNVYLVGLMQRFLSAAYHEEIARDIYWNDRDLSQHVHEAHDDRTTFRLYKTNADHLLLAIGLFSSVPAGRYHAAPLALRQPEEYIGRGGTYYQLASVALRRLNRRCTASEMALERLGGQFADYAGLLRRVRVSYFHLTQRLGDARLHHLMQPTQDPSEVSTEEVADRYDDFLDCFSAWRQLPTEENRQLLQEAVNRLEQADPEFRFQIPDAAESEPGAEDGAPKDDAKS